jgi:putative ABC transport system permease protein
MSGDGWSGSFDVEGLTVASGQPEPHAEYAVALPGYFKTLRIPILAGREFSTGDSSTAPAVVVVDEVLAKRYWPGQEAVGKRVNTSGDGKHFETVIGVVGHVHNAGPQEEGEPQIYLPLTQSVQSILSFAVRAQDRPDALLAGVRGAVRELDPKLPVAKLGWMTDVVAGAVAHERFNTLLFGIFGGVALVLATVGLYGVMAFLVTQRTREIGIRIALGGRPNRVLARIIGEGLGMTLTGITLGVASALALSRTVGGLLFGVTPTDPATYAAIALVLVAAALVASYVPARRASRVDPVEVLRD